MENEIIEFETINGITTLKYRIGDKGIMINFEELESEEETQMAINHIVKSLRCNHLRRNRI